MPAAIDGVHIRGPLLSFSLRTSARVFLFIAKCSTVCGASASRRGPSLAFTRVSACHRATSQPAPASSVSRLSRFAPT